jgi:hypothetical protein
MTRLPGENGEPEHDAREYEFLQALRPLAATEVFASKAQHGSGNCPADPISADVMHTPEKILQMRSGWCQPDVVNGSWRGRIARWLRKRGIPVPGGRFPDAVGEAYRQLGAYFQVAVQRCLEENQPDFLIISGRGNPLALLLACHSVPTRLLLLAERGNTVSWRRKNVAGWDRRTGERYEQDNVKLFDGVIAMTEEDRREFIEAHGVAPERVLVWEREMMSPSIVDQWLKRMREMPSRRG